MTQTILRSALVCFLAFASALANAQVSSGVYPFGAFDSKGLDTINLGSLNTILTLPVLHKAGRAGTNFTYDLAYNGSVWVPAGMSGSQTWTNTTNWGWLGQTEVVTGYAIQSFFTGDCTAKQRGLVATVDITPSPIYYDSAGIEHRWTGFIRDSSGECYGDRDTLSNTQSTDGKYRGAA